MHDGEGSAEGRNGLDLAQVGVLAVTSLGLASLLGEDNQPFRVGLETGDVGGERLLAKVLAAVVDGDTDGGSIESGDTSSLPRNHR